MRRIALLLGLVVLAAGCGGSAPKPDHATLTRVEIHGNVVTFAFDSAPQTITTRWSGRAAIAECGSGLPVRVRGPAVLAVHFTPAQTRGVPRRIVGGVGPVGEAAKICDFEADVGWALGVVRRLPVRVSRAAGTVTVSFG